MRHPGDRSGEKIFSQREEGRDREREREREREGEIERRKLLQRKWSGN